jgi:fatty-acid peroxygenase
MFMTLMTPASTQQLADITAEQWRAAIATWEGSERVVLFDEVQEILCRAICMWAGVPLRESEAKQRTREFAAMIDGAGAVGPRNWRVMLLRARTERWIRALIEQARSQDHCRRRKCGAHHRLAPGS